MSSSEMSRTPLRTINNEDLEYCRTEGACCGCSACCRLFPIANVPVLGAEGPGSVRFENGEIVKVYKDVGNRCWHLFMQDGIYRCALHDSEHLPAACREWAGNKRQPHSPRTCFESLQNNAIVAFGDPRKGVADELRALLDNGTLPILMRDLRGFDVHQIIHAWVVRNGVIDRELFAALRLSEHLRSMPPKKLAGLESLLSLSRSNPIHRSFLEAYIDPLLRNPHRESAAVTTLLQS